jgi:hypothetical protein
MNWEKYDHDNWPCDVCAVPVLGVNVYRIERQTSGWRYDYFHVCDNCEMEWLKSVNQFPGLD